jgi:hypothetical protein
MVVGAVRPKWVSPQIAGFVATFRFTPQARFRSEVPCDCGNLSGAVSPGNAAVGDDSSGKLHFSTSAVNCRHRLGDACDGSCI